jgi:carbon storage regulator CsrA
MLVLARRLKEKLYFPGIRTVIQVVAVKATVVRLGIEAPRQVTVLREELHGAALIRRRLGPAASAANCEAKGLSFDHLFQFASAGLQMARLGLEAGQIGDVKVLLATMQQDLDRLAQQLPPRLPGPPIPSRNGACAHQ